MSNNENESMANFDSEKILFFYGLQSTGKSTVRELFRTFDLAPLGPADIPQFNAVPKADKDAYLATGMDRMRELFNVARYFVQKTQWKRFFHLVR